MANTDTWLSAPHPAPDNRQGIAWPRIVPWLTILLLALLVIQPLAGLPVKGHDLLLHYYRIPELLDLWRQGIPFARWQPDLAQGYGYPLFNYYPPLGSYLLTIAYLLLGENGPLALQVVSALVMVAGCVGMYGLGRQIYRMPGALLATAAYTLSPHLLYQTYQRSSISNALAMALCPWVAWGLLTILRRPTPRQVALAALGIAALLLSHTAAGWLLLTTLGLWLLIGLLPCTTVWAPTDPCAPHLQRLPRRAWLAVLLAFVGGLALAAYYWLPALSELELIRYYTTIAGLGNEWRLHFARFWQWPAVAVAGLSNADLPLSPGLGQVALGIAGLTIAIRHLFRKSESGRAWMVAGAGGTGLVMLLLSSAVSAPLWTIVSPLRQLQYPWRLLDASTFFLALATGATLETLSHWPRVQTPLLAACLLFFGANALPYVYPPRTQELPVRPTLTSLQAVERQRNTCGLTSWGEYLPRGVSQEGWQGGPGVGKTLAAKLRSPDLPEGALLQMGGTPLQAHLRLRLAQPTTLTFATYWFPGWRAWIDGRPSDLWADGDGLLSLPVPAGEHAIDVRWTETPLRLGADLLSATALLVALAAVARRRQDMQPSESESEPKTCVGMATVACWLLLALLAVKVLWCDPYSMPLVRHLEGGRLSGIDAPPYGNWGDVRLVGYQTEERKLTLYWQAMERPEHDYTVRVTIADAQGTPLHIISNSHPGANVSSNWEAGQLVRDAYDLPLDESQRPRVYRLSVALFVGKEATALTPHDTPRPEVVEVPVGSRKVPPARVAPQGIRPRCASFGGCLMLECAEWPRSVARGEPLTLELVWRSLASVSTDYTVFVHLLHPDGTYVTGDDAQPLRGLYPTSFWAPGERIVDERRWVPDVKAGEYLLEVGLYELATGQRLPASGPGAAGDRVILGSIHIS